MQEVAALRTALHDATTALEASEAARKKAIDDLAASNAALDISRTGEDKVCHSVFSPSKIGA